MKTKRIGIISGLLVLMFILVACVSAQPPTPPLPPILSDLAISPFIISSMIPARITSGDNVTIRFVVTNTDNQSFVYMTTMQIGNVTLMIDVELGAYESKTVSHTITPEHVGFYNVKVNGLTGSFYVWPLETKAAEFEVSKLRLFTEIEEGADITIFVNVSNIGDVEGTHQVDLKLDGEVVYSINVTLSSMGSEEVQLWIEGGLPTGAYQVEVEGLTGSFTVTPEPSIWDKIPGFPYTSIIIGLIAIIFILWRSRKF
ncbi:MAG: hypothetical protein NWE89_02220 [Candidatus Bathyarchaeota archaeon]|nr:hypothetical protein [Candidatus Bathyarchaeota archaeon]